MSLTPLDIHHKEFHRAIRGYNEEEVDVFLDQVADEFEGMFNQNRELREKVEKMQDKVKQYEGLEQTLQKALLTAQRAADEVQQNAQKESELIVKDAELKAKEIIQNIADKKEAIKVDLNTLKDAEKDFRSQFKDLLKSYLGVINKVESGERPEPVAKAPARPPAPEKDKVLNAKPQVKETPAEAKPQAQASAGVKIEEKTEPRVSLMPTSDQEENAPGKEEPADTGGEPENKEKGPEKPGDQTDTNKDKKPQTQQDYDNYFNESSFFSDEKGTKKPQTPEPPKQNNEKQKDNDTDGGQPTSQASSGTNPIADNVLEPDQPIRYDYPEIEMEPKNISADKFSSYFADELVDTGDNKEKQANENGESANSGSDDSGTNEPS